MDLNFKKISSLFSMATPETSGGVVGIDFGSSSIKVVQLKQEQDSVLLETYGELQLGPYAHVEVGHATNLDPSHLVTALEDIVREAAVTSKNAGVAVPYSSSFVTVITVPAQEPSGLQTLIPIEARKYVPVPINQVTLDWFVIPQKNGKEGVAVSHVQVLLAAIHNEALGKCKAVVEGAHIVSAFNEIEIFSTVRSSVPNSKDTVLVVDIGAATTKLYIVSEGIVRATHSLTVGGQDLTSSLSKSLELTFDVAEEMKRQVGLAAVDNPRIERGLSLPLERMFIDARRLLEMYERGEGNTPVSSVVLAGGGATLLGLEAYAHQILGRTIVRSDPFSKVTYPAFLEGTLKDIGPSFAVAMGVALRRLSDG